MNVRDAIAVAKSYVKAIYEASEPVSDISLEEVEYEIVLALCERSTVAGDRVELLTADEPVYNRALSLGLAAELYA